MYNLLTVASVVQYTLASNRWLRRRKQHYFVPSCSVVVVGEGKRVEALIPTIVKVVKLVMVLGGKGE